MPLALVCLKRTSEWFFERRGKEGWVGQAGVGRDRAKRRSEDGVKEPGDIPPFPFFSFHCVPGIFFSFFLLGTSGVGFFSVLILCFVLEESNCQEH